MQITSLKVSHIQEIILLSNNAFGQQFLNRDYITQYINSPNKLGLVARNNKKLMGYILIDILTSKKFIREILLEKEWFSEIVKNHNTISLIKQIAVTKQDQKKGVASQLIKESLNVIVNSTSITCCLAWKMGDAASMKTILLQNGFYYQRTINNYWNKESIKKNYNCAFCGLPPCNCSTEVYIKNN